MKFSAVSLTLIASGAAAFSVAPTNEYHDKVATITDGSVALCGQDVWGCVGVDLPSSSGAVRSSSSCKNKSTVRLGDFQAIGSTLQTWQYDQGMFRSDAAPQKCLGVAAPSWWNSASFSSQNFQIALTNCDTEDSSQRWLLGDDDRVHSAANFDLCLTVNSDTQGVLLTEGAPVTLNTCTSDDDEQDNQSHRQRMVLVRTGSTPIEPFVHSVQSEYGAQDTVRLAFGTDGDQMKEDTEELTYDAAHTLDIYEAGASERRRILSSDTNASPIYTISVHNNASVIEFAVHELMLSTWDYASPVTLVARVGTAQSDPFMIHIDEPHVTNCEGSVFLTNAPPSPLPIALTIMGAIVVVAAFMAARVRRRNSAREVNADDESNKNNAPPLTTKAPSATGNTDKPSTAAVEEKDDETVESHSVGGDAQP